MAPKTNISVSRGRRRTHTGPTEAVAAAEKDKLAELRDTLEQVPDIRHDRVEFLREALREGRYHVTPEQIAEAMFREFSGTGTV